MTKEIIAIDFDDVAVKHAEGFVAFSNERHNTNLTIAEYHEDWANIWGVDKEETERRKLDFFIPEVLGSFATMDGAKEGIAALAEHNELIVVTSRRDSCRPATEEAIAQHFDGLISSVQCTTWFDHLGTKHIRPKAEICQEIGAKSLIDDQPRHCLAVAEVGIKAVLFDYYGWNPDFEETSLIKPVKTWPEIVAHYDTSRQTV